MIDQCPVCLNHSSTIRESDTFWLDVDCLVCGRFRGVKPDLEALKSGGQESVIGKSKFPRHVVAAYVKREILADLKVNRPHFVSINLTDEEALKRFERRVSNPADKLFLLLSNLINRSKWPGYKVEVNRNSHFSLGACQNKMEFEFLLDFAIKEGLIEAVESGSREQPSFGQFSICDVTVTMKGIQAFDKRSIGSARTVFISSTCYDFVDARPEVADFLESRGFIVRLSDDQERFSIKNTRPDSIETCLRNLEESDVVVCLINQRYGPRLSDKYSQKSATHVEVDHALSLEKSLLYFVRDRTWNEYSIIKDMDETELAKFDKKSPFKWLVPGDRGRDGKDDRDRLIAFIRHQADLREGNNWFNQFRDITDLKRLVLKRLVELD